MVSQVSQKLAISERRACKVLGQAKATQRRNLLPPPDEQQLTDDIIALAAKYGRYDYRRITALLNNEHGWRVNHKRVERIWRKEGLKVSQKQSKRGRLWLNDRSCIRLRPKCKDHVWSYDLIIDRTANGKAFKRLNVIDEYGRECLPCWQPALEEAKVLIEQWRRESNQVRPHSAMRYRPPDLKLY